MIKNISCFARAILRASLLSAACLCADVGASETPLAELRLVVSSCRPQSSELPNYFQQTLYGNSTDLSHRQTFEGKAVTIDVASSETPGLPHIQMDFLAFDPTAYVRQKARGKTVPVGFMKNSKTPVKKIFFERPPVCMGGADPTVNLLGQWLTHVKPFMRADAQLFIEWEPYLSILAVDPAGILDFVERNPFNGWFNVVTMHDAPKISCLSELKTIQLNQKYIQDIASIWTIIKDLLTFYHSQGLGQSVADLWEHMRIETAILDEWMEESKRDHLLLLPARTDSCSTIAALGSVYNRRFFRAMPADKAGKHFKVTPKNGQPVEYTAYDRGLFLETSFINFVWHEAGAVLNAPVVKRYLERIGFKNVSIERKTNPHNGRKNVWMIEALKA